MAEIYFITCDALQVYQRDYFFPRGVDCSNSADDERNPPEPPLLQREIKRVKNGRMLIIPASEATVGHGTTGQARFWKRELAELLQVARGAK